MQDHKKKAIGDIYEKFWKELYVVAFRRLRSEQDVEDILQDIFLSLLTGDITLDNDESVRALLHQRLKSRIINFYRKQFILAAYQEQAGLTEEFSDMGSETRLMTRELEEVVQREIDRMPGKMKEIFLLSRNELLSSEDIARQLSLSSQTVRNQISKAIKRIRTAVDQYGKEKLSPPALNAIITIAVLLLINY